MSISSRTAVLAVAIYHTIILFIFWGMSLGLLDNPYSRNSSGQTGDTFLSTIIISGIYILSNCVIWIGWSQGNTACLWTWLFVNFVMLGLEILGLIMTFLSVAFTASLYMALGIGIHIICIRAVDIYYKELKAEKNEKNVTKLPV